MRGGKLAATLPSLFHRLTGLFRSPTAPRLSNAETVQSQLDALTQLFNSKADALTMGLDNSTVTLGQFDGAMRSLIKQTHVAASVIGHGGMDAASPDTLALAQQNVDTQLAYFDAWMKDLYAAKELPSQAYMANRSKLYGKAVKATTSEAVSQSKGVPTLPFYPASQTQCHSNCKCSWTIKTLDIVNDNYDCYYSLGVAEHCPTCIARQRAANPLRVRRGVILNAEKYTAANLYA